MRTTQKVTSNELLTKQAMRRKHLLCTKITYILKPFLNVVTAGIEALVVSGNEFLYTCVKEVCHLWAQPCFDTFHQLLIIVETSWSQPVLRVGKQVTVTWSEIRDVRKVVKQLPVEMLWLQQLYVDAHCHGGAQHQMLAFHSFSSEWPYTVFLTFRSTLLMLLWSLVAWILPSALLTCPRKQLPSAFW
jgi:hypothetical protein